MIFTTRTFIIFFGILLVAFFALLLTSRDCKDSRIINLRNILILFSSLIFYGWSQPQYILLLLISGIVDFFAGLIIFKSISPIRKKLFLILSIVCNLGILFSFKYTYFALNILRDFLNTDFINAILPTFTPVIDLERYSIFKSIIIPAGISFYTFQSMSYTIDVFRGSLKPTKDFIKFMAYLSFFPQLIAGPIERASNLLPQFDFIKDFKLKDAIKGMQLISWGFFKKLVIADNVGYIVDNLYDFYDTSSGSLYKTIIAGTGFGIQIYMDFSGYSEIALGLALIIGFKLIVNFKKPYMKSNIREFWRCWNISLSLWFRDYIYYPISKKLENFKLKKELIQSSGILSVFAISGIWHGAGYNFLLWGLINGFAYLISVPLSIYKVSYWERHWFLAKLYGTVKYVTTLLIVCISWIYFRSSSIMQGNQILLGSRDASLNKLQECYLFLKNLMPSPDMIGIITAIIIVFYVEYLLKDRLNEMTIFDLQSRPWVKLLTFIVIILGIQIYGTKTEDIFIYFNF